ncbi:MAG TPA: hypothetical protein VJR92_06655 [Gemmatimonadaceae bacterium]|nr:hypothetical protein [Gemmatimonadaceae bacterium]
MLRIVSRSLAVAAMCAALSCDGSTSPSARNGDMFVLQSVAEQTLPAVVVVGDYTSWEIVADTLRFDAVGYLQGTGTEIVVQRATYPDAPPGENERAERQFQFSIVRGMIEIDFPCPDFAALNSCIAPPHYRGYLTMDGIELDLALNYPTPFVYKRIAGER